jgi:ketosteroid isomerase-like protein
MRRKQVEQELLQLEERYWLAVRRRDVPTVLALSDDPCIVTGAQGVARINHAALAELLGGAPYTLDDFVIEDAHVRVIGDQVAIVAYTVREQLTVEGATVKLDAADASIWIKKDGRWVCALHTESLPGAPFDPGPAADAA